MTQGVVARARAGLGPTLIESLTYRLGAHNTADDPTRYIDPDTLERYLAAQGRWNDTIAAEMEADISHTLEEAFARAASDSSIRPSSASDILTCWSTTPPSTSSAPPKT